MLRGLILCSRAEGLHPAEVPAADKKIGMAPGDSRKRRLALLVVRP